MAIAIEDSDVPVGLSGSPVELVKSDPDRKYFIVCGPATGADRWWIWPGTPPATGGFSPDQTTGFLLISEDFMPDMAKLAWYGRSLGPTVNVTVVEAINV